MAKVELICGHCNSEFLKEKKEYARQLKMGRDKDQFYCDLKCAGYSNVGHKHPNSISNLRVGSVKDEYSPFRTYIRRIKNRYRDGGKSYDVDVGDLKDLWELQNGICAITGVPLKLEEPVTNPNYSASLDRIDSSIGYVKGNLQFISVTINHAKHKYDDTVVKEFLSIVREMKE